MLSLSSIDEKVKVNVTNCGETGCEGSFVLRVVLTLTTLTALVVPGSGVLLL